MKNYIERGNIAIMIDAIGTQALTNIFIRSVPDIDAISTMIHTILLMDEQKWIQSLPPHNDTVTIDPYTICLCPEGGVRIIVERHIMTADGFIMRRDFNTYQKQKAEAHLITLAEERKLYCLDQKK